MDDKIQGFIKRCEYYGFPNVKGAKFICMVGDMYYYSNDESYTAEQIYTFGEK